jgi:DNA-directed RNA polymerase specialized sigma24 family protein
MSGLNGMSRDGMTSPTARVEAQAETTETCIPKSGLGAHRAKNADPLPQPLLENLPKHSFPAAITARVEKTNEGAAAAEPAGAAASGRVNSSRVDSSRAACRVDNRRADPCHSRHWQTADEVHAREQERRIYRGRTVAMLRRYMRYSIETGRLPSLLGREFFRAKVTSYSVVTFEDRVIFVHDMEACLDRLDEFSRELIARHILQEHDRWATAKLLDCNEKTVRRLTPLALDQLSEILLDRGLLERIDSTENNSCQGGEANETSATDCEQGE